MTLLEIIFHAVSLDMSWSAFQSCHTGLQAETCWYTGECLNFVRSYLRTGYAFEWMQWKWVTSMNFGLLIQWSLKRRFLPPSCHYVAYINLHLNSSEAAIILKCGALTKKPNNCNTARWHETIVLFDLFSLPLLQYDIIELEVRTQ